MSITEDIMTTAARVEDLRGGLDRVRDVIEQADSVLTVADDMLGRADDMLIQASEALQQSKRVAPRVAIVVGVAALALVGTIVVLRMRRRRDDD